MCWEVLGSCTADGGSKAKETKSQRREQELARTRSRVELLKAPGALACSPDSQQGQEARAAPQQQGPIQPAIPAGPERGASREQQAQVPEASTELSPPECGAAAGPGLGQGPSLASAPRHSTWRSARSQPATVVCQDARQGAVLLLLLLLVCKWGAWWPLGALACCPRWQLPTNGSRVHHHKASRRLQAPSDALSLSASSSMARRRYSVRAKRSHSVRPSSRSCGGGRVRVGARVGLLSWFGLLGWYELP